MRYNTLIPELSVSSLEKSLSFYLSILQFALDYSRPESGFAFISCGDAQLMLEQFINSEPATDAQFVQGNWTTGRLEYPLGRGINISIRVPKIQNVIERLQAASYPIKMGPREAWYRRGDQLVGEQQVLVMDPDGYLLRFYESLGEKAYETKSRG